MTQQVSPTASALATRRSVTIAAGSLAPSPSVGRRRRSRVTAASSKQQAVLGIGLFMLLTFGPSWALVPYFGRAWPLGTNVPSRLLGVVLPYVIMMGWQPIGAAMVIRACAEHEETIGGEFRLGKGRCLIVAVAAALGIAGVARLVKWLASTAPQPWFASLASRFPDASSNLNGPMSTVCLIIALLLVWAQAIGEEVGFRECLLRRSIHLCGSWPGLVLQAFLWGIWYAPVVLLSRATSSGVSMASGGIFLVTCLLVGALLGCLRLVLASLAPSTAATLLLTLGAGLPYVLSGFGVGVDMAIYQPCGWLPVLLILFGIRYAGISLALGDR